MEILKHTRCLVSVLVASAALTATATPSIAQVATRPRTQVVSANPFGILLDIFNAEYERKVSESATAGVGGSFITNSGDDYVNADAFYRYYPSGEPLDGWAFGVKAGVTSVSGSGTFFGLGFDANRSWLLGKNRSFYVGIGFGLKRLYGAGSSNLGLEYLPTIRFVNIGYAF